MVNGPELEKWRHWAYRRGHRRRLPGQATRSGNVGGFIRSLLVDPDPAAAQVWDRIIARQGRAGRLFIKPETLGTDPVRVNVRLHAAELERLDGLAAAAQLDRSSAVRALVRFTLKAK